MEESIIDLINNFYKEKNYFEEVKENKSFFNKNIYIKEDVLKLIDYEYVIFLGNTYYNLFHSGLLSYFQKCKILYFNYYDKDKILQQLSIINYFIKNYKKEDKDIIMKEFNLKKLKLIYFFEGNIELNTLYKKICFSREELFLTFDKFSLKNIEYKLKAFCQIAEKMGALNIKIDYDFNNKSITSKDLNLDMVSNGIGVSTTDTNDTNEKLKFSFDYTKKNYNFNLNKFDLINTIIKETEFFITKDEFESDIDLKFLIDSRCINLIKKYDTCLIFNNVSELERKISLKAKSYGLNLGYNKSVNKSTSIKIVIEFLNIYDFPKSVNGLNIYNLREGFFHLSNLIKIDNEKVNLNNDYINLNYIKINNFLYSHLKSLNSKNFEINLDYNKNLDLIKTYNAIINYNFTKSEIYQLFYIFFRNNLNYKNFKIFRSIIIKPIENFYDILFNYNYFLNIKDDDEKNKYNFYDNIIMNKENLIDKLLFTSYQYHLITNYKLKIMLQIDNILVDIFEDIDKDIQSQKKISEEFDNLIEKIEIEKNDKIPNCYYRQLTYDEEEILKELDSRIFEFKKKIEEKDKISDFLDLLEDIKSKINNNFELDIMYIRKIITSISFYIKNLIVNDNDKNKYDKIKEIIKNCFNLSFNINNGLFSYHDQKNAKKNLLETVNNILLNNYNEFDDLNDIIYTISILIINSINIEINSEKKNISLNNKVNDFIIKIINNYLFFRNEDNNFNEKENKINILNNLEKFREDVQLNYSKYKLFYSWDFFKKIFLQILNDKKNMKSINQEIMKNCVKIN